MKAGLMVRMLAVFFLFSVFVGVGYSQSLLHIALPAFSVAGTSSPFSLNTLQHGLKQKLAHLFFWNREAFISFESEVESHLSRTLIQRRHVLVAA